MNFFAHLHVARQAGWTDAPSALGSMLPDLLSLARVRADPGRLPLGVAHGRALHHRSDTLFHHHGTFLELAADLRDRLGGTGVPAGPARAVAHLGNELLLDGLLPDQPTLVGAFREAVDHGPAVEPALVGADHSAWRALAGWLSGAVPSDYAETDEVARRLHRMLARRPRLAFDARHLPGIAEVLEVHRPAVEQARRTILDDVAAGLRTSAPCGSHR